MRFAVVAVAIAVLAGCGGGSAGVTTQDTRASFERHLRRDGLVLYRASAVLRPPQSKSLTLWAAELRAARLRLHAATEDLAAAKAPANARTDVSAILAGFRFTDRLVSRLARDVGRRDSPAILRDGSSLRPSRSESVFGPFRAAVRDLRRKGYEVGVLSR